MGLEPTTALTTNGGASDANEAGSPSLSLIRQQFLVRHEGHTCVASLAATPWKSSTNFALIVAKSCSPLGK